MHFHLINKLPNIPSLACSGYTYQVNPQLVQASHFNSQVRRLHVSRPSVTLGLVTPFNPNTPISENKYFPMWGNGIAVNY